MSLYVAGIDIGSAFTKGVVIEDQKIVGSCIIPSGGDYKLTIQRVREELLSQSRLFSKDIIFTVATGFGAKMVAFAHEVRTDISCHAKGVFYLYPSVRTVVDIGDSYSRAFRIDENGNLLRFLLSSKCAGGSARILKRIAKVLQLKVEELGEVSLRSKKRIDFNTNCAVFAESEAISRIAEGATKEDLLAGIHRALAAQVNSLAERIGIKREYALVGGGTKDRGFIKAIEEITRFNVIVPPEPQLTAALGAALIAGEMPGLK